MIITALVVALLAGPAAPPAHSVDFWRDIVKRQYAPPDGSDVPALAAELVDLLGSPDPELRDEIGYSVLTAWIYQKRILDAEALRPIVDRLLGNLTQGVGERDTDAVLRRSFSALVLSVVVARDNAAPVVGAQELRRILDAAIKYLAAERDVRGYDPAKGWMHSAAHTADLLKFLGRSRQLGPADQAAILDAISGKLASSPVLTHGEDERLARAVLSIVNRADFDRDGFRAWVTKAKPAPIRSARPTREQLDATQNIKNLFAKLEVLLSQDPQASDSVQSARDALRAALKDMY